MIRLKTISAKTLYTLLAVSFSCLLQTGFSQSIVGVNNLTGTANATIPIYTVSAGEISVPVALNYSASGLKVEDYDNSVGLGWRLVAGAGVFREVRGFPDDIEYQGNASYNIIRGWLRPGNSAAQTIQGLSFANNGSSNCANEITDAATIANNLSYSYDTEPDMFSVSAPGLSCSFVFDASANHIIKIIPYRDYVISYTTDIPGKITAFTITNENGIKYYFDKPNLLQHSIDLYIPGPYTPPNDPSTLEAFKRDFQQYRANFDYAGNASGYVSYNDQWGLSKIEDTKGNIVTFNYEYFSIENPQVNKKTTHKDIEILKPNGSGGFTKKKLYGVTRAGNNLRLLSITSYTVGTDIPLETAVQFNWDYPSGGGPEIIMDKQLKTIDLVKEKSSFQFIYTEKFYTNITVWSGFGRYFLKGLKQYKSSGLCNNVHTQFDFTYYNVNEANHTCYCTPIPPGGGQAVDTIINAQDYWGYYNGYSTNANLNPQIYVYPDNPAVELYKVYPIPGYSGSSVTLTETTNRSVNSNAIAGSLHKITYPTGATTELEYENNQFFDPDVNGNVLGGGIRIKKITNYDGINNQNPDIVTYSYNDPVNTSLTTGRAISVPKFAMAFQNNTSYGNITDRVKNSTYKTTYDLNNESKDILYGKVTVTKTGIGKSIYEYNTTGTFGSADLTDWKESKNYVARTNLSLPPPCTAIAPSFLYNNNAELQYPFSANPNYDFERGLPIKVTHYNTGNQVVASEDYAYARSHTNPVKIYGVKLDEIGNTMAAYSKYGVNTVVDNFLVTKTSKLYNTNNSNPLTDVETFVYTPPASGLSYRLLKEVHKQNSDGVISTSKFTYAKEYTTAATGDDMNNAIKEFNTANKNVVIETSQHRTDVLGTKTVGASLNYFKPFLIGQGNSIPKHLPAASYGFVSQAGVTNFTPSTISAGNFIRDNNNYVNKPVEIEKYSANAIPLLVTDESRIPKTVLTTLEDGLTIAEFTNAKPEHIGFSNFDNEFTEQHFVVGTGNTIVSGGRYSTKCLDFQPNTTLCRTLVRNPTAKNLIISFWIKDAQTSGSLYICFHKLGLSCGAFTCMGVSTAVSYTAGSEWKYYQYILPWTSAFTSLSYALSTSVAVKIDDVLIYPDNANVTTYSYTTNAIATNLLTAKTGINGIGNSYEYDNAGRLWIVRDQFDNIIEMKKYKLTNRHLVQIPSVAISIYPYYVQLGNTATFYANLPYSYETGDCNAPPITYTWNFGDGSPPAPSAGSGERGSTSIQHLYSAIGKYQVTVTASSPGMTDVVASSPPVNSTNPPPFEVVAATPPCSPGTPVICAAGIVQYTSTGQCILGAECTNLPSTCNDTYFRVTEITGGTMASIYSVQWEIADPGSNSWQVHQPETPGVPSTSRHFHPVHTSSYQMRAKVKFCDSFGSTAYSNAILIKNGD